MTTTKPSRIFICPIIPAELVCKYPGTQAANTFCRHLIDGKVFDRVFSLPPTNLREDLSKFNKSPVEFICVARKLRGVIPKLFSAIAENWIVFRKIPRGSSVWFYNLGWNLIFLYWLLGFRKNVRRNIIVADFTPPRGIDLLKRFTQFLIRRADARIVLADSERFKNKNTVCIPGIVPMQNLPRVERVKREFLISGSLIPICAFPKILPWFAKHPKCILTVCGRADTKDVLTDFASRYPNIRDMGFLPYSEYLKILENSGICLSTRDPSYPENHENFPSKMIEYLLYNKVVVSTMRYPQLEEIAYFYLPLEQESFMNELEKILEKPEEELLKYANQGEKLLKKFSPSRWKKEMENLEKI